jgi:hypothetical protein
MRVTVAAPDLAIGAGPTPGRIMSSDQAQAKVNGPDYRIIKNNT